MLSLLQVLGTKASSGTKIRKKRHLGRQACHEVTVLPITTRVLTRQLQQTRLRSGVRGRPVALESSQGRVKREKCPGDITLGLIKNNEVTETMKNLNRIQLSRKTRSGPVGCLEDSEGIGSIPGDNSIPQTQTQGTENWFVHFIDEYDGTNPIFNVFYKDGKYDCILDTGAGVNLVGDKTLANMIPQYHDVKVPTNTKARSVTGKGIPLEGKISMDLHFGGKVHKNMVFEITKDSDTFIIGNPFLYEQDLVILPRIGFGTRIPHIPKTSPRHKTIKIFAAQDTLVEKGDCTTMTVKPKLQRRQWIADINRSFLISDYKLDDGTQLYPTISALSEEGMFIATIQNIEGSSDTTIKAGTHVGFATTEFQDGEELVTSVMADMVDIQRTIISEGVANPQVHHIPVADLIEGQQDLDDVDTDIQPPGFDIYGPQPGKIYTDKRQPCSLFDTQRENEGGTVETAHIHASSTRAIAQIRNILRRHEKIFSKHNYDIGHFVIDGVIQKVKLTLSDTTPIVEKYRTISPLKREAAIQILDQLEKSQIITRKASGFASQAVWVSKSLPELTPERAAELNIEYVPGAKDPTGKRNLRFCQDYRQLNSRLQQVQWPMPSVKNVLGRLKNTKYVTVLDASHSFYSIELDEQSKLYTGFQSCERNLVMNRLAMGLKSSSAILNACLAKTLQGLEGCTIPYSDNILIISDDEDTHVRDIDRVLTALSDHGWKFKLAKCHWAVVGSLKIFGMLINLQDSTIQPDPTKIKTIKELPLPSKKRQLRAFLGGIGYFIECLPDIGAALATLQDLTRLTKTGKDESVIWSEEARRAFKTIKDALGEVNRIYMPDWQKDFHLVVDAGPNHTSTMLVQINDHGNWVPLGFFNKKLTDREKKLSQVEREALAIVYGLRQTSYYVAHAKTFIHSDNKPFVLLKKYSGVNTKLARWKLWLDSFDHELVWNSASTPAISFTDFLSRPPSEKIKNRTITAADIEDMPQDIPDGIYTQPQYNKLLEEIINKDENEQINKETEAALVMAATLTTPGMVGIPPTRESEQMAYSIAAVTTRRQTSMMEAPSRTTANGRVPSNPEEALVEIVVNECPYLNLDQLRHLQRTCSKLGPIYNNVEQFPDYIIHDRLLIRKFCHGEIRRLLMTVPVCLADDLISELHKGSTATHHGKKKLIQMVRTRYFIPSLRQRVAKIIDNCGICGFYKPKLGPKGGPRPNATKVKARGPGDLWSMDHIQIVSTPDAEGNTSLLCFVDNYSHFLVCKAVPKTITAKYAATVFLEQIIARFGVPRALLSDNGPDMDNELFREMANLLGINKITISAGSAKSNGICEKVQGLVLASIRHQAAQYRIPPRHFADLAIWAALAHNSTPFQDMNPPLSPAEIFLGHSISESTFFGFANAAYAYANLEQFNTRMIAAQMTISEIVGTRERYLSELEEKKRIITAPQWDFPTGTLVALRDKAQATIQHNKKLRPRYRGVFIVVKQTATSCLIRPYSSETILQDMETEEVATRGRGKPLPRYVSH